MAKCVKQLWLIVSIFGAYFLTCWCSGSFLINHYNLHSVLVHLTCGDTGIYSAQTTYLSMKVLTFAKKENVRVCSPGWKSNIIPLGIFLPLKRCSAERPLRAGLIHVMLMHGYLITYEPCLNKSSALQCFGCGKAVENATV